MSTIANCPHCEKVGAKGILVREGNHLHCLICTRDFKLIPFRTERKRVIVVEDSRNNDKILNRATLPIGRRY